MNEHVCRTCGGPLEAQRVTRLQQYAGHWYLIENVPALVCRQCGEQYFTPDAHDLVVDLVSGGGEPVRTEMVAVYDAERSST
ncbi:MAG: YgiT-type zinc finger protein [Anaerolineae bacterium]|nr:YgiT-type zinc finger protein [Anaerolineae bacterium]